MPENLELLVDNVETSPSKVQIINGFCENFYNGCPFPKKDYCKGGGCGWGSERVKSALKEKKL